MEDAVPKGLAGGIDDMAFSGVLMFASLNSLLGIAFGWTSFYKARKGGCKRLLHIAVRDGSRTAILCLCWAGADSF